jgi:hypothetical protein
MKLAEIHGQLCDMYGEHAMSSSMVWRWVQLGNEGGEKMHDDQRRGRPSVVNKGLVRAVEEKIRENRRFTVTSLSLHFPQISQSLLHKIVSDKLVFFNSLLELTFWITLIIATLQKYVVEFCCFFILTCLVRKLLNQEPLKSVSLYTLVQEMLHT